MKKYLNYLVGVILLAFLIMVYPAETGAKKVATNSSPYIEVCSKGIVNLPEGTRFVTCHGRIMEVIAVVPLREEEAQAASGCGCPSCCGGVCTVLVICPGGALCRAYLAC